MKRTPFVVIGGAAALAATAVAAALGPASAPGWGETSGAGGAFLVGKFAEETRAPAEVAREPAASEPTREIPPETPAPEPVSTKPIEVATAVPDGTRTPPPIATGETAKAPPLEPVPPKPVTNAAAIAPSKEDVPREAETPRFVPKPDLANETLAAPKPAATKPPTTALGTTNSSAGPAARDDASR